MEVFPINCWDIKNCPASYYLKCAAYVKKQSCWDIRDGCLCHTYDSCEKCSIFKKQGSSL